MSACLAAAPIWLQWRQDSRKVEIENPFQYIFEMLQIIWVFFLFCFFARRVPLARLNCLNTCWAITLNSAVPHSQFFLKSQLEKRKQNML